MLVRMRTDAYELVNYHVSDTFDVSTTEYHTSTASTWYHLTAL